MIQIFILGASSAYGVGGENGGWADLLKQKLHQKMYGPNGTGEDIEIYNFGKSGASINFVLDTFPIQLKQYSRNQKTIILLGMGANDSKAVNRPDNFISSLDKYSQEMTKLLKLLKQSSFQTIVIGGGYFDETKTNPKFNPIIGGKSFFTNRRAQEFQKCLQQLCQKYNLPFIDLGVNEKEWLAKYLYKDGLHPNKKGHELICNKILAKLTKLL